MPALKVFSGQGHWCSWTPWRSWVFKESACTKCYAKHHVCFIHVVYMFVDCEDFHFSGGWVDSSCFHNRKAWLCFCDGCSQQFTCRSSTGDVILYSAAVKWHGGSFTVADWAAPFSGGSRIAGKSAGSMGGLPPIMSSSICSIVFWW